MAAAAAAASSSSSSSSPPSWQELAELLGPHKEAPFRLSHAKIRTFSPADGVPSLIFYRDNSSWCPYCQRVWLQLEEKQIPYVVEKINMNCYGPKPDWYLQMIPSGLLPAIKTKSGKVLPESLDIMMYIEDAFPAHKSLIQKDKESVMSSLLKQERKLMGAWLSCLRGGMWGSMGAFEKSLDAVDASLRQFGGPYFLGQEVGIFDCRC
jgi:glutathione S-transferase